MQPHQRSGSSPASQLDSREPQPSQPRIPGVCLEQLQPQPNDPVANQPIAAVLPPMPFPGPYAYAPGLAFLEADEAQADSGAPPVTSRDATPETITVGSTAASTNTTSTATTSANTGTLAPEANPDNLPPLILAARRGDLPALEALLQEGQADVNQVDGKHGFTALMFAAHEGHLVVVEKLLAAGARVNDANVDADVGGTALSFAAGAGRIDIVRLLVNRKGVDLDQTDSSGDSALHTAAFDNRPDVLLCLLEAGAQLNQANANDGNTALTLAAAAGHLDVVRHLVGRAGIELDQTDFDGFTALHFAASNNKPDVVASLLEARVSRRSIDTGGCTALALAYHKMHAAVIEVFLQHGAEAVDVDIFAPPQNPSTFVIADLQDDRKPPVIDFLGPDQTMVFFNQLSTAMQEDGSGQRMLLWLRNMGMRAVAVKQVADTLLSANLAWPTQSASGSSTNVQQRLAYCFNVLSSLPRLGAADKAVLFYKSAGISAAGIDRLSSVVTRQLETLAVLAGQAAAQLGASMLEKLVPFCLARIGLTYEVDFVALKSSLVDEGFCAPVAQAIALGWQTAIAALQTRNMTVPAGLTMAQAMQFMRMQTELHAPAEFARAMQRQLASHDNLGHLQAMLGSKNDEGLHVLFQVQCDQLKQFCVQLLESSANTETTANSPSTSSTSCSFQQ